MGRGLCVLAFLSFWGVQTGIGYNPAVHGFSCGFHFSRFQQLLRLEYNRLQIMNPQLHRHRSPESILICVWSSLRFADAQTQRCSFHSFSFDGSSLRGSCWRTKTSSRGQPWGIISSGLSSLGTYSWLEKWLTCMDDLWHKALSTVHQQNSGCWNLWQIWLAMEKKEADVLFDFVSFNVEAVAHVWEFSNLGSSFVWGYLCWFVLLFRFVFVYVLYVMYCVLNTL